MDVDELFGLPPIDAPAALAAGWREIGDRNRWAGGAFAGAKVCADRRELLSWLAFGSWTNASAFALCEDGRWLCFIQQGECTDEWLCVKSQATEFKRRPAWMHVDFESISWHRIIDRRGVASAEALLDDLFAATPEECSALAYTGAAERRQQDAAWTPRYSHWRHGGWYVTNVRYPSGACGCVSRNYADGKWRIVCENTGPGSEGDRTFPSRGAAARAERERAQAAVLAAG